MDPGKPAPNEPASTSDMIQRIKLGTLDARLLTKEQRQQCVEALHFESVSPSGIAQFLKVTDRTVRRDMEAIRVHNALTPSHDLARQIIGEFVLFARVHRGNLMKLARNANASTSERTQAEYLAYMIQSDMVAKLQSLGYLPKSADALVVMNKSEERQSSDRLSAICAELDEMSRLTDTPEQAQKLVSLKADLTADGDDDGNRD